jgi:hypothetical protein
MRTLQDVVSFREERGWLIFTFQDVRECRANQGQVEWLEEMPPEEVTVISTRPPAAQGGKDRQ